MKKPYVCPKCGNKYEWPGLLSNHLDYGACRPDPKKATK